MCTVDRRGFLHRLAAYGSGALFAPSLAGLAACNDVPWGPLLRKAGKGSGGYGELAESANCPELLIPAGFTCVKLSETLAPSQASPSFTVPQALDGMAAFPLDNLNIRLIRTHEIRDAADVASPFGSNPYDPNAGGGTTSLEVRVHGTGYDHLELELVAEPRAASIRLPEPYPEPRKVQGRDGTEHQKGGPPGRPAQGGLHPKQGGLTHGHS